MSTSKPLSKSDESQGEIQVHLVEYGHIKDELILTLQSQQQIVVIALASASVVLPIIVGQAQNLSTTIAAIILYALVIVYASLALIFVYNLYHIGLLAKYIRDQLEPNLNKAVFSSESHSLLQWTNYSSKERGRFPDIVLAGLGSIGSSVLLLLPGAFALIMAQYVVLVPALQTPQQTPTLQFANALLIPVSAIAWSLYVLALLAFLLVTIYHVAKAKSITMG